MYVHVYVTKIRRYNNIIIIMAEVSGTFEIQISRIGGCGMPKLELYRAHTPCASGSYLYRDDSCSSKRVVFDDLYLHIVL
jgi:hypothetical protein